MRQSDSVCADETKTVYMHTRAHLTSDDVTQNLQTVTLCLCGMAAHHSEIITHHAKYIFSNNYTYTLNSQFK